MDGRTTLLTGILAFILIGGGFLTLVVDNIEQDENKDDDSDSSEEQSDAKPLVDEVPTILFSDYSKSWDGENIVLSGFVTDESPTTSTVTIEVLDDDSESSTLSIYVTDPDNQSSAQFHLLLLLASTFFFAYSLMRFRVKSVESEIPKW